MKLSEVRQNLVKLISVGKMPSVFIWGAPGIGKSSMVREVAKELEMKLVDVRLSQLAPTDLRGLPSLDKERKVMEWYAPNFLPRESESRGILFVDEFNMCSGSMMGIAQQLILDRKVGDYELPKGWVIVAAGNRAEDRAAVNVMPAPVANRFIHYHIEANLDEFKEVVYKVFDYSDITKGAVLGFLNFKPDLLYKFKAGMLEFPTPRSWENACLLIDADLDPEPAIGKETAMQFKAYMKLYKSLPDLGKILNGDMSVELKKTEPSIIFAVVSGLVARATVSEQYVNGFKWLLVNSKIFTDDFKGLYVTECVSKLKTTATPELNKFIQALLKDSESKQFISRYKTLVTSFA